MIYLVLDAVTTAAILFVITSGLLIIFGVMKIINFAHAGFLTVGGYVALVATDLEINPWLGFPLALIVGAALGIIVERLILRHLYDRPLDAILATWGLGIIMIQLVTIYFGREVQFTDRPISGAVDVIGAVYSEYRLWMIAFALAFAAAMWALQHGTRLGLQTRAVIMNEPLARGLGINSVKVRLITFAFGAGLACLAGALIVPLSSLSPNLGIPWLVSAFMLVLVAGNSFASLGLACVVLGTAQVVISTYTNPVIGNLTLPILGALLLRIRPKGFALE